MKRSVLVPFVLWLVATGNAHAQDAAEAGVSSDAAVDASLDAAPARDARASAGTKDAALIGEDAGRVWASCVEHVPEGALRPKLTNTFPARGLAGHALTLQVQLEHGLGETVLPNGFHIQGDSDAARALATAGFVLPDPKGGSGPTLSRREEPDKAFTDVQIHFLSLPEKPGRHELTLPPIPIAVTRASGEYLTLCTTPHTIVIDEPIANEPEAAPQGNPPPRPQREVWTLARDLTYGGLIGALAAALIALLILWWRRRPKPPIPPPPPRPPWEVALEALQDLRRAQLVAEGKRAEHVDQVSDVVRVYLGARFGFDGIESTTDEVLQALRRIQPPLLVFDDVRRLLQDSDLVKFARWSPTDEDCEQVLDTAERIVRATMPEVGPPPPVNAVQDPSQEGGS
jgi:hypothetical protein